MFGVDDLDADTARLRVRARLPSADADDLVLLDDLLGIRDLSVPPPDMDPDARRRRMSATDRHVRAGAHRAGCLVIEDVHWIDPVSEAMLAEVVAVLATPRAGSGHLSPRVQRPARRASAASRRSPLRRWRIHRQPR